MSGFDDFWAAYPRRVGKKDARKAWAKLNPDAVLVDTMIAAITAQQQDRDTACGWRPDWPHPATWLRGERWEDEIFADEVTAAQLHSAQRWRFHKWAGQCKHDPVCEWEDECLVKIARKRLVK